MTGQSAPGNETQELKESDFSPPSQRKHPRRPAKWAAVIKTTQGHMLEGKTINVSKEGVLLAVPFNLKLGDKAFFEATVMYRGKRLALQAVAVVRHNSVNGSTYNIGFHFITATELTTRFLEQYAANSI